MKSSFGTFLSRWLGGVMEVFAPRRCWGCDAPLESDDTNTLCVACRRKVVMPLVRMCWRCGEITVRVEQSGCSRCEQRTMSFSRVISLGVYADQLRGLILTAKRQRSGGVACALAETLFAERRQLWDDVAINLVIPVPMFWGRRLWRGVSAPDLIAATLARRLDCRLSAGLLWRRRATAYQEGKNADARRDNLRNAFAVTTNPTALAQLRGRSVLLVDDVLTTGATCEEASRVLLAAGAESVIVAAIARATKRGT